VNNFSSEFCLRSCLIKTFVCSCSGAMCCVISLIKLRLSLLAGKSSNREKVEEMLKKFEEFQLRAEIYYIYHSIHKYIVSGRTLLLLSRLCMQILRVRVHDCGHVLC
jgi:hypothetical protein